MKRCGPALGLAVALALLAGCAVPPERLLILHVNDFHGQILPLQMTPRPGVIRSMGGFAAVESVIQGERDATHARPTAVWVTSGGDWYQGTPEGNEDQGWSLMACRNRWDLVAAVVGNHEFDFGEKNLIRIVGRADHPVLAANILDADGALRSYVQPYRVERLGNLRIALVGLVTSDTPRVSTGPFGEAVFADEVETLRRWLPEIQAQSDAIILLTHCGVEKDVELAKTFPAIDLILGGHSHTPLPAGRRVGDCWIAQSGGKGAALSRVEVELEASGLRVVSVKLVPIPAGAARPDPERDRFLAETFLHIGGKWDQPVGTVRGAPHRVARNHTSSPGGNYVADLMRRAGAADLGLTNKGGLRSGVALGPMTRRQVFEFLPFDNQVVTVELTGEQIRTLLGQGLRPGRLPLEIAGGQYEFRSSADGRRLGGVTIDGKPIVDTMKYRVATNSFLAGGGDGFSVFGEGVILSKSKGWLRDLMLDDLRGRPGGIVFSEDRRILRID